MTEAEVKQKILDAIGKSVDMHAPNEVATLVSAYATIDGIGARREFEQVQLEIMRRPSPFAGLDSGAALQPKNEKPFEGKLVPLNVTNTSNEPDHSVYDEKPPEVAPSGHPDATPWSPLGEQQ